MRRHILQRLRRARTDCFPRLSANRHRPAVADGPPDLAGLGRQGNIAMKSFDHQTLASQLLPAMLDAGAALLRHRAAGVTVEQKADLTPVTAADRQAESIVLDALERIAPGLPVIAEEQVSAGVAPAFDAVAFLVDALDGTR